MRTRSRVRVFVAFAMLAATAVVAGVPSALLADPDPSERARRGRRFTMDFRIEDCTFVTNDDDSPGNPFFPLVPGDQLVLESEDERVQITTCLDDGSNCSKHDGTPVRGRFTVPFRGGVETRVVEERETEDGELSEISHNFFARCEENGSLFYLGEMVEDIEGGVAMPADDAWQAGMGGARPGVIMPGIFLLGSRYFQEIAPGVALDQGENTRMNLRMELDLVGDGETTFQGCVEVTETSPLERGEFSIKVYCPGVGLVLDDEVELVEKNF